jgi:HAD superfamily hydrolase (TIGR01509 family)
MKISHIIFDCDGVLVDSEPLSMAVDVSLMAEHGIFLTEEEAHNRFVGLTFEDMIATLGAEHNVTFPDDLLEIKDQRLLALYEEKLQPVAGIAKALNQLSLTMSVASNSPMKRIRDALRITKLAGRFGNNLTSFEEVPLPKPAPDVFLAAAKKAGVKPTQCLVIEDSTTGVTAAHAAGCTVAGFTGTNHDKPTHTIALRQAGARLTFDSMSLLPEIVRAFSGRG